MRTDGHEANSQFSQFCIFTQCAQGPAHAIKYKTAVVNRPRCLQGRCPVESSILNPADSGCITSLFRHVTWRRLVIIYRHFDPIFIAQAVQYRIDSFSRNVSNQITKPHRPNYAKDGALSLSFEEFPVRKLEHNMEAIQAPLNVNTNMMNAK